MCAGRLWCGRRADPRSATCGDAIPGGRLRAFRRREEIERREVEVRERNGSRKGPDRAAARPHTGSPRFHWVLHR
jgi:hypothetical protein